MISLSEYLFEAAGLDKETKAKHKEIKAFLKDNYRAKTLEISDTPNEDGKFVVTVRKGEIEFIGKGESLVNDLFVWGSLDGSASFIIGDKCNITSLAGGPSAVGWNYSIMGGNPKLKSLEGIATNIGRKLFIGNCEGLDSLEGCEEVDAKDIEIVGAQIEDLQGLPKRVMGKLRIADCNKLKNLKGCPQTIKDFVLRDLESLTSLKGAPDKVFGDYVLRGCSALEAEDVVVNAKNRSVFDNPKLVTAAELAKQAKDAEKLEMEYSYKFDGKAVDTLTADQFAINLGFTNMNDLLSSNHPILKQYVGYSYSKTWGARIYGSDPRVDYRGYRIITTPTLHGWDRAADAKKAVEAAGYKSSSSKLKSGAGGKTKVDVTKFKDAVEVLFSIQSRHGGGNVNFVPAN